MIKIRKFFFTGLLAIALTMSINSSALALGLAGNLLAGGSLCGDACGGGLAKLNNQGEPNTPETKLVAFVPEPGCSEINAFDIFYQVELKGAGNDTILNFFTTVELTLTQENGGGQATEPQETSQVFLNTDELGVEASLGTTENGKITVSADDEINLCDIQPFLQNENFCFIEGEINSLTVTVEVLRNNKQITENYFCDLEGVTPGTLVECTIQGI